MVSLKGAIMDFSAPIWLWIGFNAFVLALLALDLGVFHRKSHSVSVKEALGWSAVWIALALLFNAGLYFWRGPEPALQFLTGYLIEKSLSVDNIFVFVLLFSAFGVPAAYQHRVLFWGVLGALVMRGILITVGVILLSVDNIFVFVLLFSAFGVPAAYQHRVLFWGVLGALVMRGILITVGVILLEEF